MLTRLSTRETGNQDLVDLLSACHERIRRFLALAREAALNRDAPRDQIVQACADVKRYFTEALPLHVADEERSIEPRLRGLSSAVDSTLDAMAHQHQQHAAALQALVRAAARVRTEPHDDRARGALASAAAALATDFEQHLALEESSSFPAIRALLPHETQAAIVGELRQRRRRSEQRESEV